MLTYLEENVKKTINNGEDNETINSSRKKLVINLPMQCCIDTLSLKVPVVRFKEVAISQSRGRNYRDNYVNI